MKIVGAGEYPVGMLAREFDGVSGKVGARRERVYARLFSRAERLGQYKQ